MSKTERQLEDTMADLTVRLTRVEEVDPDLGRGEWHYYAISRDGVEHGSVAVWTDGRDVTDHGRTVGRGDSRDCWDASTGLSETEADAAWHEAASWVPQLWWGVHRRIGGSGAAVEATK